MPEAQYPNLKGALCNIPIVVVDVCNILPHPNGIQSNGIIIVKLKESDNIEAMFILNL